MSNNEVRTNVSGPFQGLLTLGCAGPSLAVAQAMALNRSSGTVLTREDIEAARARRAAMVSPRGVESHGSVHKGRCRKKKSK